MGLCAPSGGGKTYSALKIAEGLGGRVLLIDTENGSGELYADLCDYDTQPIPPPYDPQRYVDMIDAAGKEGYDVIIVDSLTHAWTGVGGVLDQHDKYAKSTGNSYTAWREVTPKHNALIDAMLRSPAHLIATMRTKVSYEPEKGDNGKMTVRKLGLQPVQREGMDYEFTVVFDMAQDGHLASVSKDRTSLFDGRAPFVPTVETGTELLTWLGNGTDPAEASKKQATSLLRAIGKCKDLPDLSAFWKRNGDKIKALVPSDHKHIMDELTTKKHHFNEGATAN